MEPLGKKLQQARLAKSISLEEASRVTKIRASRIEEIEAEDFSSFPSLAYAKGFLLIYGKFLDVDVTPYLDAFETSGRVTVDGYSYLQGDGGAAAPSPIVRRQPTKRPALFPLFIAVLVLVVGLYLMKLFLNIQRITPPAGGGPGAAGVSATPAPASPALENIVAPRAIPVEGTPPGEAGVAPPRPFPGATAQASPTEPEVRRAQPVHPEELTSPKPTSSPNLAAATPEAIALTNDVAASPRVTPSPNDVAASPKSTLLARVAAAPPKATASPNAAVATLAAIGRVQITPVRKTFVRVIVDDNAAHPAFEGWLAPSDPPLSFRAQHVSVKVLERGAIQVTRNGTPVRGGDANVHIE